VREAVKVLLLAGVVLAVGIGLIVVTAERPQAEAALTGPERFEIQMENGGYRHYDYLGGLRARARAVCDTFEAGRGRQLVFEALMEDGWTMEHIDKFLEYSTEGYCPEWRDRA
jgi:hypothetical protein